MSWSVFEPNQASFLLERKRLQLADAESVVKPILASIRDRGDEAVREAAARFDGFEGTSFEVPVERLDEAVEQLPQDLRAALEEAIANVRAFAELQMPQEFMTELAAGQNVGQVVRPLERIAAYIPGGRYPLPSTVIMTCVPAKVAGVSEVWVTTPKPDPTVFAAARLAGADRVALLGGAQAIGAFAMGTESLPKVDRIVGPGNKYVSAAKRLLAGEVGIDFVAGPTEVVIVANEGRADWVAADLLAQAEHDTDASAVLLTTSRAFAEAVRAEVARQLLELPTREVAEVALRENSGAVVCASEDQMLEWVNALAAEHLCLHEARWLEGVRHAGSVFLGPGSPEAAGDYITGPNHVLPTAGAARLSGGLSVMDYLKVITVQELTPSAMRRLAPMGAVIARAEGLEGHARSMEVRTRA